MRTMTYKGYIASLAFDPHEDLYIGSVLGIDDVISFEAKNEQGLREAFGKAIEDYLDYCRDNNLQPESPAGSA